MSSTNGAITSKPPTEDNPIRQSEGTAPISISTAAPPTYQFPSTFLYVTDTTFDREIRRLDKKIDDSTKSNKKIIDDAVGNHQKISHDVPEQERNRIENRIKIFIPWVIGILIALGFTGYVIYTLKVTLENREFKLKREVIEEVDKKIIEKMTTEPGPVKSSDIN